MADKDVGLESVSKKGKPPAPKDKKCKDCGTKFTPVNVRQVRCVACIKKHNEAVKIANAIKPDKGKAKYPPRPCKKCGRDYLPVRRDQSYCPECRNSVEHKSDNYKMVKVTCLNPECPNGGVFETTWVKYRQMQRYCDQECAKRAKYLKSKKFERDRKAQLAAERPVQEALSSYIPHDGGQKEIHDDYMARFRVINAGTRWGKDRCSINEFIRLFAKMLSEERDDSLVPRVHAWIVAPTFPLARQSWRELKYFFPPQWVAGKNEAEHQLTTIMDGLIEVKSADNPDSLVSVGLDMVLMTEAARVKDLETTWGYLRGRLSSPGRGLDGQGGSALINSTPKGRSFYYTMYCWGMDPSMPEWKSYHRKTGDNPYINPKEIEEAKRTLPDRVFRQEFLAEFLADSGDVFLGIDDVSTGILQNPEPGVAYFAALDPAEKGDFSCFGIRNSRGEQVFIKRWTGVPYSIQISEVEYYCKKYNHASVVVDCTASGSSTIVQQLIQRGVDAQEAIFTNPLKSQWVSHLAILFENKEIVLLRNDINDDTKAQMNELKSYTYTYTATKKVSYHHLAGQHDDCVDMLLLLFKDFRSLVFMLPHIGILKGISIGKSY